MSVDIQKETTARERVYLVNWMCKIIAEKKTIIEQKAFMAKVHSVATYHQITLDELTLINQQAL
jgi:hypothetical protein